MPITGKHKMTDKKDNYIKMLSYHLSGQSSELFVEVRDRQGLCYAVQPVHFSGLEGGYWGIYIGAGKDKKQKAIDAIMSIINNLAENGVTESEFEKIKNMIHGQSLLNIQTNEDYANIYSVPVLHGLGIDQYYKNNQLIADTKIEEFNNFLKEFFKNKPNIITVGPH